MKKNKSCKLMPHAFYGMTTISERGQAVIPQEARENMSLNKGQKLLVFGLSDELIIFLKADYMQDIAKGMEERLKTIQDIIKNSNK